MLKIDISFVAVIIALTCLVSDAQLRITFFQNYSSIMTMYPEIIDGRPGTLVVESFMVDVPEGNTREETCYFVEALIKCNLKSLCDVSERMAVLNHNDPMDWR